MIRGACVAVVLLLAALGPAACATRPATFDVVLGFTPKA